MMKSIFLICAFSLAFADAAFDKKSCLLEPDEGLCRGYFPSYYYDYKSRTCKEFIYGGCGGNDNNFETEEDCKEYCGDVVVFESESEAESAPPALCQLDKETGPCRARFIRYYYNKETGECEEFVYGGCLGNINNFRTKEECEGICR